MQTYDSYKDSGVQWLGEIPSHWKVLALKHILKVKKNLVGKQSYKYDLLSLTLQGVIKRDMDNPTGKFPSSFDTYQVVEPDDFIFCNFDNEETPRAVGISPYKGMITGAYDVLSCKNEDLSTRYLIYYFLYIDDAKRFKPLYKGLRKTVPFDAFMSYKIPVPSIAEQESIAVYLDSVTSKIDEAIAQQQKMIDLLNERKQIIINNAVTKGLNPDVKMKDSGVDWIGEIPEHWEVMKLKHLISLKGRIGWNGLKSDEFEEVSYAYLVTGQDFNGADIDWSKCYQINEKRYMEDPFIQLNNGDILVTKDGSIGKIAKVNNLDKPACLNSGIFVLKQKNDSYDQDFLYWMLCSSVLKEFNTYTQTGATILHLYQNVFEQMPCVVPSKKEQEYIATYLNKKCNDIDVAKNIVELQISLLQERKQIIINDVVTGKVKVL